MTIKKKQTNMIQEILNELSPKTNRRKWAEEQGNKQNYSVVRTKSFA